MTASILLSDNGASSGVTGIKTQGGTDGTLQIQTTTSGGTATTAISIDNNQAVTIQGLTVGKGAGAVSTNTAVGASALASNSTGGNTVAIGYRAANASTGNAVTAVGTDSLRLTTADRNTAIGRSALEVDTTGTLNTAVGFSSLGANTTGSYNTALGDSSLASNTTASNNTAVGYQAGYTNSTGVQNTFIGYQAGNLTTGSYNCFVGTVAGSSTTGQLNSFIGYGAGTSVTSGSKNTILGSYSGNQGGLDIRTSSNNVVLSDGDGNIAGRWANGGSWYQLSNSATWAITSDARIKENVNTITNGLDVVMALRPVEFDYIVGKQHTEGFLAQEYENVLPNQIIEDANIGDELKALTNGEPVKGIQQNLVPYLVSAIQSLKAELDAYKVAHP